jgi:putative transcriptional regulator
MRTTNFHSTGFFVVLHRNTITLLYDETAVRVDLEAIEKLCALFDVSVGELFERMPEAKSAR